MNNNFLLSIEFDDATRMAEFMKKNPSVFFTVAYIEDKPVPQPYPVPEPDQLFAEPAKPKTYKSKKAKKPVLAIRTCQSCGKEFTPSGPTQKFCDEHSPKLKNRKRPQPQQDLHF